MAIENLARVHSEIEKLVKRVERVERAAPLGFSSISRGALRILSEEGLIVEGSARISGVLAVTGTENVTGTLNVSGTENVTGALGVTGTTTLAGPLIVNGTANITGPSTTVTGPFHVAGDQDNTGKLAIKGATTLESDLNVKTTGKIVVEGPSAATLENGELSFASGGKVLAYPQGVAMEAGSAEVTASVAGAYLWFGTKHIAVTSGGASVSGGLSVSGALANPGIALKAGAVNNLHIDADGRIWRTS